MTKRHRQLAAQHADLVAKRKTLSDEAHAIGDQAEQQKRLLGPDERSRVEVILAELDDLAPKIDAISSEVEFETRLAANERTTVMDLSRSGMKLQEDEFSGIGEFLQAVAVASDQGVWRHRLGAVKADSLMAKLNRYQGASIEAAATGLSVGSPTDGGFLVRKDWSSAMLDRAREQAVLFPRTRNIPIGSDADSLEYPYVDETSRATGSRWGGVRVYWMAEAETKTASKPKMGRGELRLEEIAGLAYATERLMKDASAMEGLLGDAFESEFAFVIDDAIVRGTGVAQPLGFFGHPAQVSVAKEAAQAADTVVAANVLKMFARMPARLKSAAVWLIHPDVMTQLPLMAIGQQPVWLPPGQLTQAPNGLLLGKPVIEIEQAEALGDQGDIFFVNLNEYVTITKAGEGLRYDTSMHVRFINNEMAFRWVFRINGQPTWRAALAPYKGGLSSSPFITLDARA